LKSANIQYGLTYLISNLSFRHTTSFEITTNNHDSYFIYMIKVLQKGEVSFSEEDSKNRTIIDQKGMVIMVPGKIRHTIKINKGTQLKIVMLECNKEWISNGLSDETAKNFNSLPEGVSPLHQIQRVPFLPEIYQVFKKIDNRFSNVTLYSHLILHSYIYLTIDIVLEIFANKEMRTFPLKKISTSELESLNKIASILSSDMGNGFPSIRSLAKLALMSESKLKSNFKEVYGMSIYQYFQKNRMRLAKELLFTGKYKVSDIAYKIGYSSLSNFTLAFQKEFELSPKEVKGKLIN
ncbi:MAG TPA: helix-turn-helix transcriptional regulator, partial [Chitinophagaceae bacterium]|nr:helix-turn-helix transcriptional regulator [Chitinophagaceae bacterium]